MTLVVPLAFARRNQSVVNLIVDNAPECGTRNCVSMGRYWMTMVVPLANARCSRLVRMALCVSCPSTPISLDVQFLPVQSHHRVVLGTSNPRRVTWALARWASVVHQPVAVYWRANLPSLENAQKNAQKIQNAPKKTRSSKIVAHVIQNVVKKPRFAPWIAKPQHVAAK
jgi:hypothetical protein